MIDWYFCLHFIVLARAGSVSVFLSRYRFSVSGRFFKISRYRFRFSARITPSLTPYALPFPRMGFRPSNLHYSGAARGGEASPLLVDVQKLCNMCVHCSKCVSFWGTSYSRPPIDPYLTPPGTKTWRRHCSHKMQVLAPPLSRGRHCVCNLRANFSSRK